MSFGFNGGLSLAHAYFGKDSTLTPGNHLFERYYQLNFNLGVFTRFWRMQKNKFDNQKKSSFIDLGAAYQLPFAGNYSYKNEDQKTIISNLHQYTDFSAFTRIGYKNLAFYAKYRLLDYLKAGYPELPKLQVGVSILLEN